MCYRKLVLVLLLICFGASGLLAQASEAKAKIDINKTAWMGMLKINQDGEPDPKGTMKVPIYVVISQTADRLWGIGVNVEVIEEGGKTPEIALAAIPLANGLMKNFVVTFDVADYEDPSTLTGDTIRMRVRKNKTMKGTYQRADGVKTPLLLRQVNEEYCYSGFYKGTYWEDGQAKANGAEMILAFREDKGKIKDGFSIFVDPDEDEGRQVYFIPGLVGTVGPAGALDVHDTEYEIQVTGTLKNGVMKVDVYRGNDFYHTEAALFDTWRQLKPKISFKPVPKQVPNGKTSVVTIRHKNAEICSWISIDEKLVSTAAAVAEPHAWISRYWLEEKKVILYITTEADCKGTIQLRLENASGKWSLSRKIRVR